MRRFRLLPSPSPSLLFLLAAAGAPAPVVAAGPGAGATAGVSSPAPVVVAQLGAIPASPAFHMNLTPNVASDGAAAASAVPVVKMAAAASAVPAIKMAVAPSAASGAMDLSNGHPTIAALSLRPNLAALAQRPASGAQPVQGVRGVAPSAASAALMAGYAGSAASSSLRAVASTVTLTASRLSASTPAAASTGAASAPTEADVFADLRERLARKLGATSAGADKSFVMRVSNQGEPGASVVGTAHVDRVATLTPRRAASRSASAGADGATSAATAHATDWDYTGVAGPEAWGRMKPEFDKCGHGERQSPIDIRDGIAVELEPIQFDYHPGAFTVVDTGHAIEVDVAPGNSVTLAGHRYELQNAHFHRPAEERIDGRQFDMSLHLVHQDAQGHLAVVTVLLEPGSAQATVQTVLNNLPLEKHETVHASGLLDPAQWLPTERRYYTYMGSLTTPPCTEGVLWMVLKQPVQLAPAQEAIFARLYPMNARPVQAASGRLIKQSQ